MTSRIQSCIDHIKTSVDIDPWAAELAEKALRQYELRVMKLDEVTENLPVVDAISVEWLKAHKTKYYEDYGVVPVSVEEALTMWQKEQEAKQCEIHD